MVALRVIPGQRDGAKRWFEHFQRFLKSEVGMTASAEEVGMTASAEAPNVLRCDECILLIHVDDAILLAETKWTDDVLLPALQKRYTVTLQRGSTFSFLKRVHEVTDDAIYINGSSMQVEQMVHVFRQHFGSLHVSKTPFLKELNEEDKTANLDFHAAATFRSLLGSALYQSMDRADLQFTVKTLRYMQQPTQLALRGIRKLLGYMLKTVGMGVKFERSLCYEKLLGEATSQLSLQTFSDSDWSGNYLRKSTSSAVHALNNCVLYTTSRTQKLVSLSSTEAEWHSATSAAADGIYIKRVLEFLVGAKVNHSLHLDNTATKALCHRQGVS